MWRRRARTVVPGAGRKFDAADDEPLRAAVAAVRLEISKLTLYMCWHGGAGHDYPNAALQAAARLRQRHPGHGVDDAYTSLSITPTDEDLADFVLVAPYCDLAYATDAEDDVVLEVSGEGESGSFRGPAHRGRCR